jgi:nucleoside-diphosphate-sugar epimerase
VISNKKVLVTGVTGTVGKPVAQALAAAGNDVWGLARFSDAQVRAELAGQGNHVRPV